MNIILCEFDSIFIFCKNKWLSLSEELCKSLSHDRRERKITTFGGLGRVVRRTRSPRKQLIVLCTETSRKK